MVPHQVRGKKKGEKGEEKRRVRGGRLQEGIGMSGYKEKLWRIDLLRS